MLALRRLQNGTCGVIMDSSGDMPGDNHVWRHVVHGRRKSRADVAVFWDTYIF
eukprot:gene19898-14483_t